MKVLEIRKIIIWAWVLCLLLSATGALADPAAIYVARISSLIEPAKLATMGKRAANPRVQKYVAQLEEARLAGNGNTRYLTATNAAVTDTYVYDAFGVVITNTGTTTNYYRYAGEQFDPNLGFVYLRSRYMNPNAGRFLSRDSFAGANTDPKTLHRYLYVADNPINNIDPSGNSLIAANVGSKLHKMIADDFTQGLELIRFSGPSVATLLGRYGINISAVTALFPDLVDISTKEVYEIKPVGVGVAEGYAQLAGYLQLFNYFDPAKNWKPGSVYSPPKEITIDPLNVAFVSPPERGVIIYKIFSVKQFAKRRAVNVAVSNNADIEDSVGISTLTGLLGGI